MFRRVVWLILTIVSEALGVFFALMMEAVSFFETSVSICSVEHLVRQPRSYTSP
jgi:hypothetical protein